jgi:hypothetical protein
VFSRIRKRFSYTNLALTFALVFAMTGGAYAAGKYVITSTKQISPKVLKSLQGKAGTTGQAGTAGPAGPAGATGAKGEIGTPGKQGEPGKEGKEGPVGKNGTNGKEGEEGPAGPTGPQGSPWVAGGTLPSGSTETGVWSFDGVPDNYNDLGIIFTASASISFTIPLAESLEQKNSEPENNRVHVVSVGNHGEGKFEAGVAGKEGLDTGCPTTSEVAKPEAEPGNLCIFEHSSENVANIEHEDPENGTGGAGKTGIIVIIKAAENKGMAAGGTWAVTAK